MQKAELGKKLAVTAGGILLFWLLANYAAVPTGVENIYLYLQYPLLCQAAVWLGPVFGCAMGLLGHLAANISLGDVLTNIPWMIGSGLLGLGMGLWSVRRDVVAQPEKRGTALQYSVCCLLCCAIAFGIAVPVMNIVFNGKAAGTAFQEGWMAVLIDGFTSVLMGQLSIGSARNHIFRRIAAAIVMVEALLLLSYGRRGFGNVAVYVITILLSCYALFADWIRAHSRNRLLKVLQWVLTGTLVAWVMLMAFIGLDSYSRKPLGTEQTMVVLGAGLDGTEPNTILKARLDTAAAYLTEHPEMRVIVSGGQGADEVIPEAQAMRDYLVRAGIAEDRILMEAASATTEENFAFSAALMAENGLDPSEPIVYVTSDYHCWRARQIAVRNGFSEASPLAAATSLGSLLPSYIRESVSVVKMLVQLALGRLPA